LPVYDVVMSEALGDAVSLPETLIVERASPTPEPAQAR